MTWRELALEILDMPRRQQEQEVAVAVGETQSILLAHRFTANLPLSPERFVVDLGWSDRPYLSVDEQGERL